MADEVKRGRGRPRKTLTDAHASLAARRLPTRAENRERHAAGERTGARAESGVAYAVRVAAEWEAQSLAAGASPADAKREAARLASDDLVMRQMQERAAPAETPKPGGGRSYIPNAVTIWETDLATGVTSPVSLAQNARACGHEAPSPLADRAKPGRSQMDRIARGLSGKGGARAREAAKRAADMGSLADALRAAGDGGKLALPRVPRGRKPKSPRAE